MATSTQEKNGLLSRALSACGFALAIGSITTWLIAPLISNPLIGWPVTVLGLAILTLGLTGWIPAAILEYRRNKEDGSQ